jgi:chromate transporter
MRAADQGIDFSGPCLAAWRFEQGLPMQSETRPSLGELTRLFAWIGFVSFGGAAGQIAMMHSAVVDERKWLDEKRYLHALNYCMLLPGPEAQQLATYIGWLTHGVRGGLIAGLLFVLPGAAIMIGLSFLYIYGQDHSLIDGMFFGIKAAVPAIIVMALLKIGKRSLKGRFEVALALTAFLLMLFFNVPFPVIVLAAGVLSAFVLSADNGSTGGAQSAMPTPAERRGALRMAFGCLLAWWLPIAVCALLLGPEHRLTEIGLYFSKLAVITFGGAYAVLAYLAQTAVEMGWVSTTQMIDGLGLAETTPGPTILVNQFVAFIAGLDAPQPFAPWLAAVLGAAMASWATFAPSFLWIFAGAPFVETLRRNAIISAALRGITASVVGVIAYVGLWFALHVIFATVGFGSAGWLRWPVVALSSLDLRAALLCALGFFLVFQLKRSVVITVAILATLGAALALSGI